MGSIEIFCRSLPFCPSTAGNTETLRENPEATAGFWQRWASEKQARGRVTGGATVNRRIFVRGKPLRDTNPA